MIRSHVLVSSILLPCRRGPWRGYRRVPWFSMTVRIQRMPYRAKRRLEPFARCCPVTRAYYIQSVYGMLRECIAVEMASSAMYSTHGASMCIICCWLSLLDGTGHHAELRSPSLSISLSVTHYRRKRNDFDTIAVSALREVGLDWGRGLNIESISCWWLHDDQRQSPSTFVPQAHEVESCTFPATSQLSEERFFFP